MSVNRNDTVPLGRTCGLMRPIIAQRTTDRFRPWPWRNVVALAAWQ